MRTAHSVQCIQYLVFMFAMLIEWWEIKVENSEFQTKKRNWVLSAGADLPTERTKQKPNYRQKWKEKEEIKWCESFVWEQFSWMLDDDDKNDTNENQTTHNRLNVCV